MCDYPKIFDVSNPTARKDYKCCECKIIIKKGEKYYRNKGLWENEWDEFIECEECHDLREKLMYEYKKDDIEIPFGELENILNECMNTISR